MVVGKVVVQKIAGERNPADLMTNVLHTGEVGQRCLDMGMVVGWMGMCWIRSGECVP